MIIFLQILIGILSIYSITGYSAPITMKSAASASSITDYFIDFAECSCNIMPSICDNYCCCDSLCGVNHNRGRVQLQLGLITINALRPLPQFKYHVDNQPKVLEPSKIQHAFIILIEGEQAIIIHQPQAPLKLCQHFRKLLKIQSIH